jgi:hypothetical protein
MFGEEHSKCQAELMGLSEPTYFKAKVLAVETVKTQTGKINKVSVELDKEKLVEVKDAPVVNIPEDNVKPLASDRDSGITLE